MRTCLVFALALLLPTSVSASDEPAAPQAVPAVSDPATFADALDACTPATHQAPHPFMTSFTIEHVITGEAEGDCAYSQTMPGGMHMACSLSAEGRAGLAEEFREQARGRMSGSTSSQPGWTKECDIVSRDGKRTPMGG